VIAAKILGLNVLESVCITNPFVNHLIIREKDNVEDPKAKLIPAMLRNLQSR